MQNDIIVHSDGKLLFQGKHYRCALGRAGVQEGKREGDRATPAGEFFMRKVYYRPDKFEEAPKSLLPIVPLKDADGWSDDVTLPEYNTFVTLPYPGSHERLWRDDDVYDIIIPLSYNDDPPIQGLGSAIFIHIARENYSPTAGCIALSKQNLLDIIAQVDISTKVCILKS